MNDEISFQRLIREKDKPLGLAKSMIYYFIFSYLLFSRINPPVAVSPQIPAQLSVTNQNHQIDLDLEGSFPPLPGSANASSKNGEIRQVQFYDPSFYYYLLMICTLSYFW